LEPLSSQSALRANADLPTEHGTESDDGWNRDKIGRALHPISDVGNPWSDARGQEIQIEWRNWSEAIWKGPRPRPQKMPTRGTDKTARSVGAAVSLYLPGARSVALCKQVRC
jgi:hypothetical protein